MLNLQFGLSQKPLSLLCVGAHSDDVEIGCGGTVLRLLEENPEVEVCWVVLAASGQRMAEAEESAEAFLRQANKKTIILKEFKDGYLPYSGADAKAFFEELKGLYAPDVILTHYRHDLHQDHRIVSELTWNTFRDHFILEYEIAKYDGDLGNPNFFVPLSEATSHRKVGTIMDCFKTQRSKSWFTEDTFFALLRLRGVECNAPHRYAEAFYCRKAVY
jgi:LmbE family N-acetylglucosaminyl deacetylase